MMHIIFTVLISSIVVFKYYDKIRMMLGDILALFGTSSKFIRKKSIENRIEGNLNHFARKINNELDGLIIPRVKVEFVSSKNINSFINDGMPIIRMKFGKNNNENMAVATMAYVNTALLDKSRPYLKNDIGEAIDHSLTRRILADYKKGEPIGYFDENYLNPRIKESQDFAKYYSRIDEVSDSGLLTRILLREYKEFGVRLFPKRSTTENLTETEDFLDFIYAIAVRKKDDRSELSFTQNIITVGVVLVSKLETFQQYGMTPYIRRIRLLAGKGVKSVYLLARGKKHKIVLDTIVDELRKDENYRLLSHNKFKSEGYDSYCVLFELDYDGLMAKAKILVDASKEEGKFIDAIVTKVDKKYVEVDVEGLPAFIPLRELSEKQITNADQYFHVDDELKVKVLDAQNIGNIVVSNRGSETDPILRIEREYSSEEVFGVNVKEIRQSGLVIDFPDGMKGFVPKSRATFSRFEPLENIYSKGDNISVRIIRYDVTHQNLISSVVNVVDPWGQGDKTIKVGSIVKFKVWVIEQRKILGEISPGVEGVIFKNDLGWGIQDVNKLKLSIGETIDAKIKELNSERRLVILTRKELENNPIKNFYESRQAFENTCKVKGFIEGVGLEVEFDGNLLGRIHISELDWVFVDNMTMKFPVGTVLTAKLLFFDENTNIIWASRKILIPNPIEEFQKKYSVGDEIRGTIEGYEPWGAKVSGVNTPKEVKCILSKGEITDLCFIGDAKNVMELNKEYGFLVKLINSDKQRVILTRKGYLKKAFKDLKITYGTSYKARIIGKNAGDQFVVESNDFQAVVVELNDKKRRLKIGENVDVYPASINNVENLIEVAI